ncbi:hypothetical protein SAMN02910353_01357 [Ruminococcus sp. YRD2003]|uniref:hypothetical protein n=1 Tax=Ruminococcus sp. YRD2003 TaxID=1452313 RepID=UPI0008CA35FB|nr:hypothetical protein SAMN02910353_01357 [Ruminococcus flavefaciens]
MTDNINNPPENEELDLEKLNGVSGGFITNPTSGNKTEDYEVWDDSKGEVIGTFPSLEEAREAAKNAKLMDKLARIDKKLGGGRMG